MKTITVTFKKSERQAVWTLRYNDADRRPFDYEFSGDVEAFLLKSGNPIDPTPPLFRLERDIAFQAAQAGAEFSIEDDGGDVRRAEEGDGIRLRGSVDVYTATFQKGGYQATCELRYWGGADQPMLSEWTGDEDAHRLPDGSLFKFRFPQETLEQKLASQAEQIGAEFSIRHERLGN